MSIPYHRNQRIDRTTLPCANPDCDKTTQRIPSEIARVKASYCSIKCAGMCNKQRKYTDEVIAFIKANLTAMGYVSMAERIGVKVGGLRRSVTILRDKGHDMPYLRLKQDGDIKIGKRDTYKKVNGKWVYVCRTNLMDRNKPKAEKPPKPPKEPKIRKRRATVASRRPPKKGVVRLPNRVEDPAEYKMVWVAERKLWVNKKVA